MTMELRIENLSKQYPNGTKPLQSVSLSIPLGMFGLLGPNGAGKSTLMRTLATLQEAVSGHATLGDIDVLHQKDAVRRVLGPDCGRSTCSEGRCLPHWVLCPR